MLDINKRLLVIGAHPDDCEYVAGISLKMKEVGFEVRYLMATNGASGHHELPGAAIVNIRKKEVERVAKLAGFTYEMLDLEDGRLTASLESRDLMLQAIRRYNPGVIITHRPFDYHPDHRATSMLVQDCSYLLLVPNICPLTPPMRQMPAIFYMQDTFMRPCAFRPDLVFDISNEYDKKMLMIHQHQSQFYEWLPWVEGMPMDEVPQDDAARLGWLKATHWGQRSALYAKLYRGELVNKYGNMGQDIQYAEALEACEYGRQLSKEELAEVFPL
ncbi:MAG: PIG-L family deacetylase [Clostridiales bacterium]|nr:PIG-L family deacetylase [Clostridiales bacterium]